MKIHSIHRGYRLVYTDKEALASAGFGLVAHLPCVFDSRPGYHRLASQFLIDRGLGLWDPVRRGAAPSGTTPTPKSIQTFGSRLCNYLEWCDVRSVDPLACDYAADLIGRYQKEMLSGIWSRDATALAPRTVNSRIEVACEYLCWLADKQYRSAFNVPSVRRTKSFGSATNSVAHRPRNVAARVGKMRPKKRRLSLPKDEDVGVWLSRLYKKYGLAKGLMAELILLTAVRREEAASWRVDTLPKDKANWKIVNLHAPYEERAVLVTIRYGCKGGNYGEDHGDKIGPEGTIKVPLSLADKIHEYRTKKRPHALLQWVKSGKSLEEQRARQSDSVHLFLDEGTGSRIKAQALYDAWTGVELPFRGWSPHLGRDWWACSTLWIEMRKHEHLLKSGLDIPHALLESTAIGVIRLQIQPQLRHVSQETTLMYLIWVSDMLGFNLSIDYENDLSEGEV